jgi:2-desacetyl-2-hydroxyethyl bacteriochlorophyllide A dehydrogenase
MKMKAVRLIQPGRPLEMQEVDVPQVGPRDVLVRVEAAGICHSDAHYRSGVSPVYPLPMTLGHEVAGVVEQVGADVAKLKAGDRVCLHYMVTCGDCEYCNQGREQFCTSGKMIGKHRDGGYAEYIAIPARSAFVLPDEIPFAQGAVMMCSSATSLHAVNKARLRPGETVAVFGVGGLGMSAIQLAQAYGALRVYAVDVNPVKLEMAERFGAVPVNAQQADPVDEIRRLTGSRGVDVALELIGLPLTMDQAFRSLAVFGRVAIAGLTDRTFEVAPYRDLLNREAEIIGVSDHLAEELPRLIEFVRQGQLDLSDVITEAVDLDAGVINDALDELDAFGNQVRVAIAPFGH